MNDQDQEINVPLFSTIQRDMTLADRVAYQLETLIVEGQLRQGDPLPTERELATQLGVSRTVVREAMRGLVAKHLLEVQPGNRTVVSRPTVKSIARSMSLLISDDRAALDIEKVFEVRRLLEVEIAGKAAERRTEEDLMRMDEILKEAESNRSDREVFARLDVSFHQALADATHNPLFSLLLDSIADVMVHVRLTGFRVPGTPERGIIYHRGIYEQVQAENAEGARRAMVAHLIESEETQRLAMAYIQQNSEMKSKESETGLELAE